MKSLGGWRYPQVNQLQMVFVVTNQVMSRFLKNKMNIYKCVYFVSIFSLQEREEVITESYTTMRK